MQDAISIEWKASGRGKARCAPDLDYPNGKEINIAEEGEPSCTVPLTYPAAECGAWLIRCSACNFGVAVTAAGRPDDPRSVRIPCNRRKEAA